MYLTAVKTRKSWEYRILWHSGWWEVKSVLLLVSMVLSFFFPSELVQIYGKFVCFFFLHNFDNHTILIIVILTKQVLLGTMHSDISYSWSFVFCKWFLYNDLGYKKEVFVKVINMKKSIYHPFYKEIVLFSK